MATRIVHVIVKIDAEPTEVTDGEVAAKAMEVIDSALYSAYGGDGWHVFGHHRAISVEGAHTLPMEIV